MSFLFTSTERCPMPENFSEPRRNEWIDASDTKEKRALRAALIATCLIAAGFIVHATVPAPADVQEIGASP
jgi:hypothetical protein